MFPPKGIISAIALIGAIAVTYTFIYPRVLFSFILRHQADTGCFDTVKGALIDNKYIFITPSSEGNLSSCPDFGGHLLYDRSPVVQCRSSFAWNNGTCSNPQLRDLFQRLAAHQSEPRFGLDASHTVHYQEHQLRR